MSLSYNSFSFLNILQNFCKIVGEDEYGNTYFVKKSGSIKNNNRERRFIVYSGIVEASKVPQEWNAWLHHVTNDLPKKKTEIIMDERSFTKHDRNTLCIRI